ncbi:MAG: 3-oxoacyl-[acyl-carrier-protein] synthase 3 [Holosporales bacterium]
MYTSRVVGFGHYLPQKIMKNTEFEPSLQTSDEWIESRTGIKQRHIADSVETTSYMATKASEEALLSAGWDPSTVDMIIVATTTPDHPFPATAVKVQANLKASKAFAFDVQAVCSGFIYALSVADQFIKSGQIKRAIVVGADKMSSLLNWKDRNTAVLFGDGAGAYLLESTPYTRCEGIISTHLFSDGSYYDLLYVDTDEPFDNKRGFVKMEGRSIYKHAIKKIGDSVVHALKANHLTIDDVDWLVPHQANRRILEAISDQYSIPFDKMIVTVGEHANTCAGTIPLATYEGIASNKIKKGNLIVLEALGGGLSWGSAVIRI